MHGKLAEKIPKVDTCEVEKLHVYMCMKQRKRYGLKGIQREGNRESKEKEVTSRIINLLSVGVTEPKNHLPSWLTLYFLSVYTINLVD